MAECHAADLPLDEWVPLLPGRSRDSIRFKRAREFGNRRQKPGTTTAEQEQTSKTESATYHGDECDIDVKSKDRITTLGQLVEFCNIDLDVWAVERWTCNKWEVGAKDKAKRIHVTPLFQIKAVLRRKVVEIEASRRIAEQIEDAKAHAPVYLPVERQYGDGECMALLMLPDLHLGKLSWWLETGHDYDLHLAVDAWKEAVTDLLGKLTRTGDTYDRIALVFGNDFLNQDNLASTTTRGTPQQGDGRFQKIYRTGRELLVWTIEQARLVAPVSVIMVPGNHDAQSVFTLGDSLLCWFHHCGDVEIDNRPTTRKYMEYGRNMFGFSHGDALKPKDMPLTMATEEPQMWGRTVYRECHTGHLHQVQLQEMHGVYVRINPALTATDAWHHTNGFTGNRRSAEAFVYSFEGGLVGHHIFNLERARRQEVKAAA